MCRIYRCHRLSRRPAPPNSEFRTFRNPRYLRRFLCLQYRNHRYLRCFLYIHGPTTMTSMVYSVLRREQPWPNHDDVHGLIRSEKRAPMAHDEVHGFLQDVHFVRHRPSKIRKRQPQTRCCEICVQCFPPHTAQILSCTNLNKGFLRKTKASATATKLANVAYKKWGLSRAGHVRRKRECPSFPRKSTCPKPLNKRFKTHVPKH